MVFTTEMLANVATTVSVLCSAQDYKGTDFEKTMNYKNECQHKVTSCVMMNKNSTFAKEQKYTLADVVLQCYANR